MQSRRHYLQRKLLLGSSRWYRMKHLAQDPQVRLWSLITVLVGMGIFYFTFLFGMPSLSDIQTNFKESSVIYDKE